MSKSEKQFLAWFALATVVAVMLGFLSACAAPVGTEDDASVQVNVESLTAGNYYINNTDINLNYPSRTAAFAAVMRGAIPGCLFHCYTSGGQSFCQGKNQCSGTLTYATNCQTVSSVTERCDVGIGLATAGFMNWTIRGQHAFDGTSKWGGCPANTLSFDASHTEVFPYCSN